jgi:PEP-CTERM motif
MSELLRAVFRRIHPGPLSVTLFLSLASTAAADPITGIFDVHIQERFSIRTEQTEPFDGTFRLQVTFDDGVRDEVDTADFIEQTYGPPTFSNIPLPIAARPTGWDPATIFELTEYFAIREADGTWTQNGSMEVSGSTFGNTFGTPEYGFDMVLEAQEVGLTTKPELNPSSLLAFLGRSPQTGNFRQPFNFGYDAALRQLDGTLTADSFRYSGVATTASLTPEPSTIALLGLGALGIVARMRWVAGRG